jgi:peptidoglycan-N-acetylglucosamine deacetylase
MRASLPVPDVLARVPWRSRALMRASIALHAAAAASVLVRPSSWPWALGAVLSDHLFISAAGLLPRSQLLGANLTRLPVSAAAHSVALTIDDGPDPEVTPQVLALLERQRARATFFCIGARVRQHAALAREIVARGHAIENHSERHLHRFSLLGPRAMADEVSRAQESIHAVTGEVAQFFRAPAGLRNPFLEGVLAQRRLALVSWTRRGYDTINRNPARILARLTHTLAARDILLLHDGHAAHSADGTAVILGVLPPLLETITAAGLQCVTLRSACAGMQRA